MVLVKECSICSFCSSIFKKNVSLLPCQEICSLAQEAVTAWIFQQISQTKCQKFVLLIEESVGSTRLRSRLVRIFALLWCAQWSIFLRTSHQPVVEDPDTKTLILGTSGYSSDFPANFSKKTSEFPFCDNRKHTLKITFGPKLSVVLDMVVETKICKFNISVH